VNDVGIRLNMLQADIMDAMFLPEPQATTARNLKGNVILDTQKEDLQLGTLVFINDSTKVSEDKVKSFLTAYNRSVDSLNEYGIHAYDDILEQYLNITRPTIDSLPNKYQYKHAEKPRQKDIERVKQWWSKRQDSMKYVEKRYIQ
jgi:NitT/TauT family transport system substrate-binding protein